MLNKESENKELLKRYKETGDPEIREEIIEKNFNIVNYLSRKLSPNPRFYEDILQVASIGLINAIDRYESSKGKSFSAYAIATIVGEIKRYFRDKTWRLSVPRSIKELIVSMKIAIEKLYRKNGRYPTYQEIADELKVKVEDLIEAQEVKDSCRIVAFGENIGSEDNEMYLEDFIGKEDKEIEGLGDKMFLSKALDALSEMEGKIIRLKYFDNCPQREIARILGISQSNVSKLLEKAIIKLKKKIFKK